MYHCEHCNQLVWQLAWSGIGWACPICAKTYEAAARQARTAADSHTREFWNWVAAAAVMIGVIKLIDKIA